MTLNPFEQQYLKQLALKGLTQSSPVFQWCSLLRRIKLYGVRCQTDIVLLTFVLKMYSVAWTNCCRLNELNVHVNVANISEHYHHYRHHHHHHHHHICLLDNKDDGSLLGLCMQDYKSLCASVTTCATLVNIQTHTETQTQGHFIQRARA